MILESVKKSVTKVYSWSGKYIMCYYGLKRPRAELKSCYHLKERVRLIISQYIFLSRSASFSKLGLSHIKSPLVLNSLRALKISV